jgi:hypothetical protein
MEFAMSRKADIKRYPLNMRTTKSLRQKLEKAAAQSGRSLAQEVESRLEQSFVFERHLIMSQGDRWSPVLVNRKAEQLWVTLGNDVRDFPVGAGEYPHEETTVVMDLEPEDLKRLLNYFSGAPWPYNYSNYELKEAADLDVQMQIDLRRGK